MKMPTKGESVTVRGYGSAIFAGAHNLEDEEEAKVFLKFEGTCEENNLDEGYGRGIIEIPLDEFKEKRVRWEQISNPEQVEVSTEKRDKEFEERFKD